MLLCFFFAVFCNPRVCAYDGCYYCFECHENNEYYIPAKILHNWDFQKYPGASNKTHLCVDLFSVYKLHVCFKHETNFYKRHKTKKHVQLHLSAVAHSSCIMHMRSAVLCDLVCQSNLVLLRQFEDVHLVSVTSVNPRLYDHVKEMQEAKVDPWRCCSTCMCM